MPPKKRQSNQRQSRTNTQDIRAHLGLSQRESQTQNKDLDDDILIADYRIAKQRITRHQGQKRVNVTADQVDSLGDTLSRYQSDGSPLSDALETADLEPSPKRQRTILTQTNPLPTPQSTAQSSARTVNLIPTATPAPIDDTVLRPPSSFQRKRKVRATRGDGDEIWAYSRVARGAEPLREKGGKRIWYCASCAYSTSNYKHIRKHLPYEHNVRLSATPIPSRETPLLQYLRPSSTLPQDNIELQNQLRNLVDSRVANDLLITLITRHHMSFRFVEYPEFHELIAMFNPAATDVLIKSHTSVARHVERLYDLQQEQLKQALAQSRSKIHFTCDTWTSNYAALELLAVTARWVTPEGRLTKALLNLHNLPLGHAGLETAPRLIQTIKQFGITNPGYITSDNADCNDTMMKEMSEVLEQDMGITWDPIQNRTRCFGHQNNLILEAFWKRSSEEAIDAAVKNTSQPEAILDREESGWASEEAVRHLEWFMKTVKSKKRLNRLFRRETGLAPIANNATRWNSYYAMFERALLCRETITQLQMKHAELREFPLFPEHWRVIQYTFDFLKEFLLITKDAEGDNATLEQARETHDLDARTAQN
jgi:hypothetical protein